MFFLNFRAVFHFLDGVTTGPKSYKGQIGQQLVQESLDEKAYENFKSIIIGRMY